VTARRPHPAVWTLLYLPFGALGGFVTVAMTFEATKHGLTVGEGALLNGANMLTQWMKWAWAPIVDVTLTAKRWYLIATVCSAIGVLTMSAIPLGPATLGLILGVIAVSSLINSIVGMAIEAIISANSTPEDHGRISAWFQTGNLGGFGLGGGIGLFLIEKSPAPWIAGAVLGVAFLACCVGLLFVEDVIPHPDRAIGASVRHVFVDLKDMVRTQGGLLAAFLCLLPVGTGAVQATLTQAEVAAQWGAGETEVMLVQGVLAAVVTAAGCFAGGWVVSKLHPQVGYSVIGLGLAAVAVGMAAGPATVTAYVVGNLVYAFGVGLAYAAFTAVALNAMGSGSGATKYNVFASLANFPIWWLGLLLGQIAGAYSGATALYAEAAFGVAGVAVFFVATRAIRRTSLPTVLPAPAVAPVH